MLLSFLVLSEFLLFLLLLEIGYKIRARSVSAPESFNLLPRICKSDAAIGICLILYVFEAVWLRQPSGGKHYDVSKSVSDQEILKRRGRTT